MRPNEPKNEQLLRAFRDRSRERTDTDPVEAIDQTLRVGTQDEGVTVLHYGWHRTLRPGGGHELERFGAPIEERLERMAARWREPEPARVTATPSGVVRIEAALPGCRREDIEVEVTESGVLLRAASPVGPYREAVTLSHPIDAATAVARFEDGRLIVEVDRVDHAVRPAWRRIRAV